MELLGSLDTFQWAIIGLGAVVLFWPAISGLFKQDPAPPPVPEKPDAVVGQDLLGVTLDTDQVVAVASIVVAWVIGDTVRETK